MKSFLCLVENSSSWPFYFKFRRSSKSLKQIRDAVHRVRRSNKIVLCRTPYFTLPPRRHWPATWALSEEREQRQVRAGEELQSYRYTLGFHHLRDVRDIWEIRWLVSRGAYLFKTWKDEEERGVKGSERVFKCVTHAISASGFRLDRSWKNNRAEISLVLFLDM